MWTHLKVTEVTKYSQMREIDSNCSMKRNYKKYDISSVLKQMIAILYLQNEEMYSVFKKRYKLLHHHLHAQVCLLLCQIKTAINEIYTTVIQFNFCSKMTFHLLYTLIRI